jgi:hypothetical protein
MARIDFDTELFGAYNYLTYMAQNAPKGAPKQIFWEMEALKDGDFDTVLDEYTQTLGLTGDSLADYENQDEWEGLYGGGEADAVWELDPEDFFDEDFFDSGEGVALEEIFADIEDGDVKQGLSNVEDIVRSTIPTFGMFGDQRPPEVGEGPVGVAPGGKRYSGLGAPLPSGRGQEKTLVDAPSGRGEAPVDEDPFFDYSQYEWEGLYGGGEADAVWELDPQDDDGGAVALGKRGGTITSGYSELFAMLDEVGFDIEGLMEVMDEEDMGGYAVTAEDIQAWMDQGTWEGTPEFRAELLAAMQQLASEEGEPETKKPERILKEYYKPGTPNKIRVTEEEYEEKYKQEGWLPILGPDDPTKKKAITQAREEGPPPPEDAYATATENLGAKFFSTIYKQSGVGYADQKDLDSLNFQTQILFFLEKGETAWQNVKKEDAPALEQNYQTYLNEYLKRPFAQRIDPAAGLDFYSLVKDVSRIFTKSKQFPDIEGEHAAGWAQTDDYGVADRDKKLWVDGLFGEGKESIRDELVKLGLTRGGMGKYSQSIHNAAQRQMDYYRDIGWTEARIFHEMTQGMKKPQLAQKPDEDFFDSGEGVAEEDLSLLYG